MARRKTYKAKPKEEIVFLPAKGSHLSQKQVNQYGPELKRIHDVHGELKPSDIVHCAKAPNSPLHCYFEWDDSAAAKAHRLAQARTLARSIEVVVRVADDAPSRRVRAFVSLVSQDVPAAGTTRRQNAYRYIKEVVEDPTLRQEMIRRARMELNAYIRKWEMCNELGAVIDHLKVITEKDQFWKMEEALCRSSVR